MAAFVQRACDDDHVGDENAQANPALESVGSVSHATPELYGAFHDTDATLDTVPKPLAFLEPSLVLAYAGYLLIRLDS